MRCAVGNCKRSNSKKSVGEKSVHFYSFPKNSDQKKLWINFCKRKNPVNTEHERICSLHFKNEDFERNLRYEMGFSNRCASRLKPGVVPSIDPSDFGNDEESNDDCNDVIETHVLNIPIKDENEVKFNYDEDSNSVKMIESIKCEEEEFISNEISTPMAVNDAMCYEITMLPSVKGEEEVGRASMTSTASTTSMTSMEDMPSMSSMTSMTNVTSMTSTITTSTTSMSSMTSITNTSSMTSRNTDNKEDDTVSETPVQEEHIKTLEAQIEALRTENKQLKISQLHYTNNIKNLKNQIQHLKTVNENYEITLSRLFSEGQIRRIKNGDGRRKIFSDAEITNSLALYSSNSKAYCLLRKKHFPLPSVRTLQKYIQEEDRKFGTSNKLS